MSEYMIDPMWFYWMNVVHNIKFIFLIIIGAVGITLLTSWAGDVKHSRVIYVICFIFLAIAVLGLIFIPSKETLIQMQIAKFATYENANWTLEQLKLAVDYIVEAVDSF